MTRIETELYDLAETIMRNDDMTHKNDYHTIYDLAVDVAEIEEENSKLKAENEKLREMCSDMHEWMSRALYEGSARRYEYESITERMDEIGVPHE